MTSSPIFPSRPTPLLTQLREDERDFFVTLTLKELQYGNPNSKGFATTLTLKEKDKGDEIKSVFL